MDGLVAIGLDSSGCFCGERLSNHYCRCEEKCENEKTNSTSRPHSHSLPAPIDMQRSWYRRSQYRRGKCEQDSDKYYEIWIRERLVPDYKETN
jgi:hypothetical protein